MPEDTTLTVDIVGIHNIKIVERVILERTHQKLKAATCILQGE